jgi:Ca2+-dependent lipid-binding protein
MPDNQLCTQMRLYDEDLLKSDDDLGTAMVSLATLEPGKVQELSLDLKGKQDSFVLHPPCYFPIPLAASL